MKNTQIVAERIKSRAKENGLTVKSLLETCSLGVNTVTKMSSGTDIMSQNLLKIADVLDCSVDYLLGRSETPKPENAVLKTNSGNVVKGINAVDFPVTVSFPESSLDENQRELLELFGRLPYKEKISLMQELIQRTEKS